MPFAAVAVLLLLLATLAALIGHCNNDHKTLIACALYTLAGLSLASGLVVFASVVSDVSLERSRSPGSFQYRYGWSFFSAGAAFVLSEIAALLCITAYLRRFPTPEAMVRAVVPGAERKLLVAGGGGGLGGGPPLPSSLGAAPKTPDLCTREPQCQSCRKERERRRAPPPSRVLHSGVLAVAEPPSSWSSGSSSSVCEREPPPHHHPHPHHQRRHKANSLSLPHPPVI